MKTVRKLLYGQILGSVLFATVAFLALFFFFDLVDELKDVGQRGYQVSDALWACVLGLPGHLYDVFPITLLIGATLALSRLAQTSEFTILRTAGLGPGRALGLLAALGVGGALLMFSVGEWLMPLSEQALTAHRAEFRQGQGLKLARGGAWLRESPPEAPRHTQGRQQVTINVGEALGDNAFLNVRIFQFDAQGRLARRIQAAKAEIQPAPDRVNETRWVLYDVRDAQWQLATPLATDATTEPGQADAQPSAQTGTQTGERRLVEHRVAKMVWASQMSPAVVSAAVLPIDTMTISALWRYTEHLAANAQAAQKYELQFWKKASAPLACVVMLALALPFAYLQTRSGGISVKVFGGIMLGISFVLVNHISGHLGLLHQWQPWLAALAPSVAYTLLSLSAFLWLVRNR